MNDSTPVARPASGNARGVLKLIAIAMAAFAFTFALIPLYRIACEKVFGIRLEQGPAQLSAGASAPPAQARMVTVLFDGGVNSQLPWAFGPHQSSMQVPVGELQETTYFASNRSQQPIVGSAAPSVAPARASAHFSKTECFCFTAQTLQPGETRDLPVRFVIDPALPADIQTVTLSYTFYKNDALTADLTRPAVASAVHASP